MDLMVLWRHRWSNWD